MIGIYPQVSGVSILSEVLRFWESLKVASDNADVALRSVLNTFPPADAFWCNSSRWPLKTLWPKLKIAHDEQFHLWPQCFQLHLLTIKRSFMEIFQVFVTMFSKSSAADSLYVGFLRVNTFYRFIISLLKWPSESKVLAELRKNCKKKIKIIWLKYLHESHLMMKVKLRRIHPLSCWSKYSP